MAELLRRAEEQMNVGRSGAEDQSVETGGDKMRWYDIHGRLTRLERRNPDDRGLWGPMTMVELRSHKFWGPLMDRTRPPPPDPYEAAVARLGRPGAHGEGPMSEGGQPPGED